MASDGFEVIEGTVVDVTTWEKVDREGESFLVTEALVLGDDGRQLVAPSPGGTVGERTVNVPGSPRFEIGDRVLLVGRLVNDRVKFRTWGGSIFIEAFDERGVLSILDHQRRPAPAELPTCDDASNETLVDWAQLSGSLRQCFEGTLPAVVR